MADLPKDTVYLARNPQQEQTMSKLEELRAERQSAWQGMSNIKRTIFDETRDSVEKASAELDKEIARLLAERQRVEQEIRAAVEAKFAAELQAAKRKYEAWDQAIEDVTIAQARKNPLVGKVFRKYRERAIVEVVTRGSLFPASMKYRPAPGMLVLRYINKDGSHSLRTKSLGVHGQLPPHWTPVAQEAA